MKEGFKFHIGMVGDLRYGLLEFPLTIFHCSMAFILVFWYYISSANARFLGLAWKMGPGGGGISQLYR